jgi:hypothetical protein
MLKRILLALALAASLGGAVVACNSPSSTTSPSVAAPSLEAPSEAAPSEAAPSAS